MTVTVDVLVIGAGPIVVTGGIGTFTPRPLPAGEEFLTRGSEYFVPDPTAYAGRHAVVVGGGDNRHLVADATTRTNLDGVLAAGHITDYPGKVRLIAVGLGEVATAVNSAAVHLDLAAQLFPGHSTDLPRPVPVAV